MLIFCKGFKKNGINYPCSFIHVGKWQDFPLIEHESSHTKFEDGKSYFWLGFEVRQGFEKISGRDGKN